MGTRFYTATKTTNTIDAIARGPSILSFDYVTPPPGKKAPGTSEIGG